MADIFREVDEDLRRHQLLKLWRNYGKLIIVAVVALILAVGAVSAWHAYWNARYEKDSLRFAAALDLAAQKKTAEAAKAFGDLQAEGSPGYGYLAGIQAAEAEVSLGANDKAVARLKSLAASKVKDPALADYAELLAIMHSLDKGLDADMSKRLAALAEDGKPWAFMARQLQAVAAYKAGRGKEAQAILTALAGNVDAPQGIRDRAQELATVIGTQK